MDAKILYDIYTTTRTMGLHDLTFGLGQYHADHPGAISHDQDKAIREFIGRHYDALVKAYGSHHLDEFEDVVAKCVAADAANEQ